MDVFDEYALSNDVREEMYKCYPNAKLAHLKSGGNFPYLSRSAEVNLHLQVCFHFQQEPSKSKFKIHNRNRLFSDSFKTV